MQTCEPSRQGRTFTLEPGRVLAVISGSSLVIPRGARLAAVALNDSATRGRGCGYAVVPVDRLNQLGAKCVDHPEHRVASRKHASFAEPTIARASVNRRTFAGGLVGCPLAELDGLVDWSPDIEYCVAWR